MKNKFHILVILRDPLLPKLPTVEIQSPVEVGI